MSFVAKRLRIRGRVQGVGYRESMRAEATRLGVQGWVRNRADSSVEAHVQGNAESVEALLTWAGRGPVHAAVTELSAEPAELDPAFENFQRKETI